MHHQVRSDAAIASGGALGYTPTVFEGAAPQDTPTELGPGDAVVIGVHADDVTDVGDVFAVLLLVDAEKGTELHFTDDGLNSCAGSPSWRGGEGVVSWKADKGYTAGTVVQYPSGQAQPGSSTSTEAGRGTWTKSGSFSLSASGEPLYAYQGSKVTPRWVYAISGVSGTSAWDDGTGTTNGCLPTELSNAKHHFHLGVHRDNFFYNSDRVGALLDLLLWTSDPTKWTASNTPMDVSPFLVAFEVVASGCDGVSNSGKLDDACGVCGGDGSSCAGCDGVPNSGKTNDVCGLCDGDGLSCARITSTTDAVLAGNAVIPLFNVEGVEVADVFTLSDNTNSHTSSVKAVLRDAGNRRRRGAGGSVTLNDDLKNSFASGSQVTITKPPCDGVLNSGKVNDACGVCDGDGSSCAGCDGVSNSGKVTDACGICGGDGSSCARTDTNGCEGLWTLYPAEFGGTKTKLRLCTVSPSTDAVWTDCSSNHLEFDSLCQPN